MHRTGNPATLGGGSVVLGQLFECRACWLQTTMVDRVHPLATCSSMSVFRILYDVRTTRCDSGDSPNSSLDPDALFYLEYYRQVPPRVPHFIKTLFRRKLVLWCVNPSYGCVSADLRKRFLASEILRDYWLSGVSAMKASCVYADPDHAH